MPIESTTSSTPMKLIVTGGAGYIGSVCTARLLEAGHEVTVVDDLSTGHADAVPEGARFVQGDAAEVASTLLAEGFDGVLHFAAKSLVGESMQDWCLLARQRTHFPSSSRGDADTRRSAAGVLLDSGDVR